MIYSAVKLTNHQWFENQILKVTHARQLFGGASTADYCIFAACVDLHGNH
jgi:hypothetical protein